ncbi:2-C-methyl-D-erythritol 2,4-cyclodiphosphate synthase [Carnobacterium sp. AT7]|uniref:2-C-methyl-D-erythritol 2,4-cyclodiphosphate synthase n=1 Tax=Carnobacterium TaxID=2747 RepID=UPI00015F3810|nr:MULTISPECIES: 2-C-methyl-D-erythritol 2,4-cyclodiphosphate synthase [Carnobacterium]EDP67611.1 2-C-methyl-D-erythritol 2,4-cyclodiphosphate synthase [Carnobacterium sp. AT7]
MFRIGQGYDVHQFASERRLVVGGVDIPFEYGLLGHSDADVLLHAIIDALLGAAGKGDIGRHFPETDEQFKNIDSRELLRKVWSMLKKEGYTIGNIDATIVAETPKMAPYLEKMIENIAYDCQTTIQHVNVKATTSETMGFVGRKEGMAAMASCLIEKLERKPAPISFT